MSSKKEPHRSRRDRDRTLRKWVPAQWLIFAQLDARLVGQEAEAARRWAVLARRDVLAAEPVDPVANPGAPAWGGCSARAADALLSTPPARPLETPRRPMGPITRPLLSSQPSGTGYRVGMKDGRAVVG